jgi:hypothetical protein
MDERSRHGFAAWGLQSRASRPIARGLKISPERSQWPATSLVEPILVEWQQPARGDAPVLDLVKPGCCPPPFGAADDGAAVGEHHDVLIADEHLARM